jgi:hypothetical protein
MVTINIYLAAFALWVAVVAVASPSVAYDGEYHIDRARATAVHDCSVRAGKYSQYTWGVTELNIYRVCMNRHGQKE